MLQIITGLAGPLWDQAARTLKASYDQGRQSLLLVPDQMTLQAERDMLGALESKGFFGLQVLSPSRLATRVFDRLGRGERVMIDERGQAMTLARTIWSLRDELRYYGSSRGRPGFVRKLAEAIPGATVHPVRGDHVCCVQQPDRFVPVLLDACADVTARLPRH